MCHCVSSCPHRPSATLFNRNTREAGQSIRRSFLYVTLLSVLLASACPWAKAQDPSVVGQFSSLMSWPFNPTHAVLLPSGKVFWWPSFANGGRPQIWDPIANTNTAVTQPGYNIFCGGHSLLENGQVLVTGGDAADSTGVANASIYDPVGGTWAFLPNMSAGRWYPTNTALPNGDVVVTSGEITPGQNDPLPEVWQVSSGTWRELTTAQLLLPLYPEMYVAPNGNLFYAGPSSPSRYLDTTGTGSWTIGPSMNVGQRGYGPSVMYDNGKIMVAGGGLPTATAEIISLNDPVPTWTYTGSMANARRNANATVLPDGTVLVTGGTSGVPFDDNTNPVYPAELWSPATGTWSLMASLSVYRGYHSVALLLPDGRVLSAGGECTGANCNRNSAEIFSPPYLFAGARPTITSAPASISGGQTFFVGTPDAANVTRATWVRLGAVTHTFNQEQRFSSLSFSQTAGGLNVTAPPSANLAPPGFYMLFLLNGSGVPSIASIIQVDNSSFATNGPAVSVSVTALAFAVKPQVGTTSVPRPVQLTNLGTSPVTINSITTGADFTVTSTTCGSQLTPGSCTINVAFKPTTSGQLNEFLTINDSDSSSPQTVALSGVGVALKASSSVLNFGNHTIGTTGTALPITLTNLGTGPVNITSISYPNPEFSQYLPSSTCGTSIPGKSSCEVFSSFTPNAPGLQNGSFVVSDSDPSSPTTIKLTGDGLALTISPASLSFGNLNLHLTHSPVSLTVTNLGPVTVNFSSITLGGTNPGDFAIQNNTCGAQLGAGTNCAVAVTFKPQAAGLRSATIIFADDAFGSPQVVPLTGRGVAVLSSIAVTSAQTSVAPGNTQQFTATGTYNDGTNNNVTATATWSSSNTGVATISNTSGSQGLATGVALGTTTITASVNSVKGSTTLAVQNTTTTTVSSNNNPSTFGQTIQFTATVSPSAATGTVQFLDGSNILGTSTLSGGTASFATNSLTAGAHNITAAYKGDTNDAGSTSSPISQTVNQVSTTTTVSSNSNPSTFGQAVQFTATVSSSTATGTVQFLDGGNLLGTGTLSGGTATFTISSLTAGAHSITAAYTGDTNDAGSTSSALSQTVNQVITSTALSVDVNPATGGQTVNFTATVSPSTATGSIQFVDSFNGAQSVLGTVALSAGVATLPVALPSGTHSITAVYSGDTNNTTSTSAALVEMVN